MTQRGSFKWNGDLAKAKVRAGAVRGLTRSAEELLTRANMEVPIERSDLQGSGTPSVDAESLRGAVSYGTYDTPYAVDQHENMGYQHDPGRKAKYLEDPLNGMKNDGTHDKIMAEEIGGELK